VGPGPLLPGGPCARLERKRCAAATANAFAAVSGGGPEAPPPGAKRAKGGPWPGEAHAGGPPTPVRAVPRLPLPPALAQARLRREAEDPGVLPPEARVSVDPERLRALVAVAAHSGGPGRGWLLEEDVQFELSFPSDYPFRPPSVLRAWPERALAALQQEGGRSLQLPVLSERRWSFAMGLAEVAWDLARARPSLGGEAASGAHHGAVAGADGGGCRIAPLPLPPDDVDMA